MQAKYLPLNTIPDHPKYVRLPSLSRSLVHSILPKVCQAMHNKPVILTVPSCISTPSGPPKFTNRFRKKFKGVTFKISKPENIRPNSPSYTYKKMFSPKPSTPMPKHKYYKSRKSSYEKPEFFMTYYCEINSASTKSSESSAIPHGFSTTLYNFATKIMNKNLVLDKDLGKYTDKIIMKNISEVRSSQESSNESLACFHLKSLSN